MKMKMKKVDINGSMHLTLLLIIFFTIIPAIIYPQTDTAGLFHRTPEDTTLTMNMDAVYGRPFLTAGTLPVALGGYLEANTQYAQHEGITEGLAFQARRLTLFISSTIGQRLKFLTEVELEDGGRDINIEFAALDIELHPLLNVRGGIVMNPIGAFNQNHDGPRWDFVDRPLMATTVIPSTLSNAGFGLYGKHVSHAWTLGYEAYLTNGFDDAIIVNEENRTSLAAGKKRHGRFEDNVSGRPMLTAKIALRQRSAGEIGLSYMGGVYNTWRVEDLIVDERRRVHVVALDFNTAMLRDRLSLTGEIAAVRVDIPETYSQAFGERQLGAYLDVVGTIVQGRILGWDNARLNIGLRFEYVDYNRGRFAETGGTIGDNVWAIVPAVAFRPVGATVLRINYRYESHTDLFGNPPERAGVVQLGVSTYF